MQVPNEAKRQAILKAARVAFTRKPFHEVKLDDVAATARVGKGTIYVYFDNKDHLYVELVTAAMEELLSDLRLLADEADESGGPVWPIVETCVAKVAAWTAKHPKIFDMMRSGVLGERAAAMRKRRREMGELLGRVLTRAAKLGETNDPHPAVTANFIPAMARAGVVWGPGELGAEALRSHILQLLTSGIRANGRKR
ncbi:MAG: TetR/AcrR family transcriptional regulator [Tepidisphaeraceae bacterium]